MDKRLALLFAGLGIATAFCCFDGCDNSTTPTDSSPYYLNYHAGAPINKDYSNTIIETDAAVVFDSVQKVNVKQLKYVATGRCSCGALTDQFFMITDTTGKPYKSVPDSGSLGFKVNGEQNEAYLHGVATIDSIAVSSTGYYFLFHGRIKYGNDSVDVTKGIMFAPPTAQ